MTKLIVTGQIARYPLGGVTWDFINYLLGFKALGLDVHYFEDGSDWFYNPLKNRIMKTNYNLKYLSKTMNYFGLKNNWTYLMRKREFNLSQIITNEIFGDKNIEALFKSADLIINVCGSVNLKKLLKEFKMNDSSKKIFVDSAYVKSIKN